MPYAPGIAYRGDQYLYQGLTSAVDRIEQERKQAKQDKKLRDSYITQGEAMGLNPDILKQQSLGGVAGMVEGEKLKRLQEYRDVQMRGQEAQTEMLRQQAAEFGATAGTRRELLAAQALRAAAEAERARMDANEFGQTAAVRRDLMDANAQAARAGAVNAEALAKYNTARAGVAGPLAEAELNRSLAQLAVARNQQDQQAQEAMARAAFQQTVVPYLPRQDAPQSNPNPDEPAIPPQYHPGRPEMVVAEAIRAGLPAQQIENLAQSYQRLQGMRGKQEEFMAPEKMVRGVTLKTRDGTEREGWVNVKTGQTGWWGDESQRNEPPPELDVDEETGVVRQRVRTKTGWEWKVVPVNPLNQERAAAVREWRNNRPGSTNAPAAKSPAAGTQTLTPDKQRLLEEAKEAIRLGAPADKVKERLKRHGITME